MNRKEFLKKILATGTIGAFGFPLRGDEKIKSKKYNVLFIAVDDLNDWVGCLGGNPQTITPNLDKFAKQYGMVMNKAFCPSTICCPTRTALLTGLRTSSTGVYGNSQNLKNAAKAKDAVTLPQYFAKHGYYTLSRGKVFHKHPVKDGLDEGQWAFMEFSETSGEGEVIKRIAPPPVDGVNPGGTDLAWGAIKAPFEKSMDYQTCKWGADQLKRDFDGKPFFMAIGVSKPHLPWFVPQKFFDMHPLDKIKPVEFHYDDLDDIVDKNGKKIFKPSERFILLDKAKMHNEAARAYLAAASYADACIGVLFDALEKSKYKDNTIVMLWGDHGWYLGEKLTYGKSWLWEEAARVPFILNVPGVTPPGYKCDGVVNLMDMYPTLIELCGLPPKKENEGRSFAPLLFDPKMKWDHPTLTTFQYKNHSITDGKYRYTCYGGKADGAEEFYDHSKDPMEWTNRIKNPEYKNIIAEFKKYIPAHDEPNSPKNKLGKEDKQRARKGGKSKRAISDDE